MTYKAMTCAELTERGDAHERKESDLQLVSKFLDEGAG